MNLFIGKSSEKDFPFFSFFLVKPLCFRFFASFSLFFCFFSLSSLFIPFVGFTKTFFGEYKGKNRSTKKNQSLHALPTIWQASVQGARQIFIGKSSEKDFLFFPFFLVKPLCFRFFASFSLFFCFFSLSSLFIPFVGFTKTFFGEYKGKNRSTKKKQSLHALPTIWQASVQGAKQIFIGKSSEKNFLFFLFFG